MEIEQLLFMMRINSMMMDHHADEYWARIIIIIHNDREK